MVCFLFITPLATISGWLCLRGAVDHLHFSSRLEAVGLIALTVALFTIYLFWTLVSMAQVPGWGGWLGHWIWRHPSWHSRPTNLHHCLIYLIKDRSSDDGEREKLCIAAGKGKLREEKKSPSCFEALASFSQRFEGIPQRHKLRAGDKKVAGARFDAQSITVYSPGDYHLL